MEQDDFELKELLKAMRDGGIWSTPEVAAEPTITLTRWSVRETERGERHFVGYNFADRGGRVSTAIQTFDPETCQGVTKSGRIYQLVGPAGNDRDGDYVWNHWGYVQGQEWREVSSEYVGLEPKRPGKVDEEV